MNDFANHIISCQPGGSPCVHGKKPGDACESCVAEMRVLIKDWYETAQGLSKECPLGWKEIPKGGSWEGKCSHCGRDRAAHGLLDNKFEKLGRDIGAMVDEKDAAYGNSFDESWRILAVLYPNGIKVEQYTDMLAITRIVDKLKRIATDRDALGESPYRDIAGYGLLGANRVARLKAEGK